MRYIICCLCIFLTNHFEFNSNSKTLNFKALSWIISINLLCTYNFVLVSYTLHNGWKSGNIFCFLIFTQEQKYSKIKTFPTSVCKIDIWQIMNAFLNNTNGFRDGLIYAALVPASLGCVLILTNGALIMATIFSKFVLLIISVVLKFSMFMERILFITLICL